MATSQPPALRWGKPYESLEIDEVKHFMTGEPIAKVNQANSGIIGRDMLWAQPIAETFRVY